MLHRRKPFKLFLFTIFLWCFSQHIFAQEISQSLNSSASQHWQFYCTTNSTIGKAGEKFPAKVPGTIHLDLLDNKLIPDPFYADNEKRLQWIDTLDWVYETTFDVDSNLFKQNNIELQFDGLDTYGDVYLNDELIARSENMFCGFASDQAVKENLREKNNALKIVFHSTQKEAKNRADCFRKKVKMELPEMERVFVRKAQYQFGWDFAPRFLGCGIWRSVRLFSRCAFDDCFTNPYLEIKTKRIANDTAFMSLTGEVHGYIPEEKNKVYFKVYQDGKKVASGIDSLKDIYGQRQKYFGIDFNIIHPNLWWCNGEGKPIFNKFIVAISFDGKNYTNHEISVAIKTSEFVHQKDSIGESFYFKLNGKPIFIKGANWVPADVFLPRVSHEKYRTLLTAAKDAGMNMLRVWGGGIYEDEYFYDLCDSLGIMVWQDWMYACAPYPFNMNDENENRNIGMGYIDCIATKGIYSFWNERVPVLSNLMLHPCVTLWCGNNEIEEGWNNWGWKEQLYKSDSVKVELLKNNMDEVFNANWGDNYIPSSPKFGWGHKESLSDGDSHYWGVWWGMEPYEMYKKRVPRFASEYGMQSLPCLETIRKFAADSSLRINSVALRNHQKHPTGFENLDGYLKYYGFKVNGGLVKGRKVISEYGKGNPDEMDSTWSAKNYHNPSIKEFEDYINATQQLQADALKTAITAHMQAQPRCMGTIIWQLNDCWPGASWSLIDYYGNKKKAYYEVQKLFAEKK